MKKTKRIALVHDSFLADGGAEEVLVTFLKMYPDADVYTSVVSQKCRTFTNTVRKRLQGHWWDVTGYERWISYGKPFIWLFWRFVNLNAYDLVISSSHSFSSKLVRTDKTTHICYCHTPPRFLYNRSTEQNVPWWLKRIFEKTLFSWLRIWEQKFSTEVDVFVANSHYIRKKIWQIYRRKAVVVYPPIETQRAKKNWSNESYYVYLGRLVKPKRVDIIIQAGNILQEKLYIVGEGEARTELQKLAHNNITFLGYLSDKEKKEILKGAKAVLFSSPDEDFGIVPVEAMMQGTPVIAFSGGALRETVIDGETGVLYTSLSAKSLVSAIRSFEKMTFSSELIQKHAQKFSQRNFIHQFKKIVEQALE